MRTIKTIPTLMLAASLGAGMILVSEAALARNNGHQEHSDHQEHNGRRGGNVDRSSASQSRHFSEPRKKDRGKVKVTGTGTAGPLSVAAPLREVQWPPRTHQRQACLLSMAATLREVQWPPRTHQRQACLSMAATLREARWPP